MGHYIKQCPLEATGEWYCYICKIITNHNANMCTKSDNQNSKSLNTSLVMAVVDQEVEVLAGLLTIEKASEVNPGDLPKPTERHSVSKLFHQRVEIIRSHKHDKQV